MANVECRYHIIIVIMTFT